MAMSMRRPLGYDEWGYPARSRREPEQGAPGKHRFEVVGVEGDLTRREVQAVDIPGGGGRPSPMRVEKDGKPVMTSVPHADRKQLRYRKHPNTGEPVANARSFYYQNAHDVAQRLADETGQAQAIVDTKSNKVIGAVEPGEPRETNKPRDRYLR